MATCLLVATMLTQIATEEGRFQMADVIRHVVTKLIRRHPHVFGDVSVDGRRQCAEQLGSDQSPGEGGKRHCSSRRWTASRAALPALQKARILQSRAAKQGLLDRHAVAHAEPALAQILGEAPESARVGEMLWRLVALAHQHDIDAEDGACLRGLQRQYAVGRIVQTQQQLESYFSTLFTEGRKARQCKGTQQNLVRSLRSLPSLHLPALSSS